MHGDRAPRQQAELDEAELRERIACMRGELQLREFYSDDQVGVIARIADQMGMYFRRYGKGTGTVFVISSNPLPNYRADLDRRPPEEHELAMDPRAMQEVRDALREISFRSNDRRHEDEPESHPGRFSGRDPAVRGGGGVPGEPVGASGNGGGGSPHGGGVKRYVPPGRQRQLVKENWDDDDEEGDGEAETAASIDDRGMPRRRSEGGQNGNCFASEALRCPAGGEDDAMRESQTRWVESSRGIRMTDARRKLPAFSKREHLLRTVANSQVIVVSGETGCGKTTQLPQFILEDAIESGRGSACNIICTQPRRISAISVAQRVAQERGEDVGMSVGYQIRLESRKSSRTRLLFCTTGVLLRRLVDDPMLGGVSHIVIDEIHERGMNEDFLLIIVRDILPKRPDLRVVLMSATLNADLFASYFGDCPIEHIPGLTFPVEDLYLEDVLEATAFRIQPSGGEQFYGGGGRRGGAGGARRASGRHRGGAGGGAGSKDSTGGDKPVPGAPPPFDPADFPGYHPETLRSLANFDGEKLDLELVASTVRWIHETQGEGAILVFLTGWDEIQKLNEILEKDARTNRAAGAKVLPLHGAMPTVNQREIFERPGPGMRKIVLATNIAETSITIDDVVFVVNGGKAKEKTYDTVNNLACLLPVWTSRASARQRRGRAGRVQAGKCFHLFTRPQHGTMEEFQLPELLRTPLAEIVMQIKALRLGRAKEFLSRAPQPPEDRAVDNAIDLLRVIGALDRHEELTPLGKHLAALPVDPRVGKMLVMGAIMGCLTPTATIAAGLAHRDPFVMPLEKKEMADEEKRRFGDGQFSDHIAVLNAFEAWQRSGRSREFCFRHFLSHNTLQMMEEMRDQFIDLLSDIGFVDRSLSRDLRRRGLIGGALDAHSNDLDVLRAVICAGLFPSVCAIRQKKRRAELKTKEDGKVELHPASVLSKEAQFPEGWLVYNEKVMTTGIYLRDASHVPDYALLMFGGELEDAGPGAIGMLRTSDEGDTYIRFSSSDEEVSLIRGLRQCLDDLLMMKIEQPASNVAEEGRTLVGAVHTLLRSNSQQINDAMMPSFNNVHDNRGDRPRGFGGAGGHARHRR